MKSRRHFVKQSALAATALLAANPFKSFASWTGTSFGMNGNTHLVFLHTAESALSTFSDTHNYINTIKNNARKNTILVHAGPASDCNLDFDINPADNISIDDYMIVDRNGVRTGFIHMVKGERNISEKVQRTADLLKNERSCQLVVFLSQLGFQNRIGVDDCKLAAASENIDLIIGSHPTNYTAKTIILRNKNKSEVIVQASKTQDLACGKIEISFDERGNKKFIHVSKKLLKDTITA
jgi:hypothetical protein